MAETNAGAAEKVDLSDLDGKVVEVDRSQAHGKEKMVPLAALADERKQRQTLDERIKTLEKENADFKTYVQKAEPLIGPLRDNQEKFTAVKAIIEGTRPSVDSHTSGTDDPEARELAAELELVDQEGKPDIARGRRILDRMKKTAKAEADTRVAPVQGAVVADRARDMRAADYAYLLDAGVPQEQIDAAYKEVPDAVLATTPGASQTLRTFVLGRFAEAGGRIIPAAERGRSRDRGPIETESPGGRSGAPAAPTEAGEYFRTSTGKSEKEWQDLRQSTMGAAGAVLE